MPMDYGSVPTTEGGEAATTFRKSRRCNDVLFAIAFVAHLGLIIASWWTYSTTGADDFKDYADKGVWKFVGATTGMALFLSSLTLFFMAVFADELVEIGLVVSLLCTALVAGYGVYIKHTYMMVIGGIAFVATVAFTCYVWKKIPFAAANLKTALRAVRTNFGLIAFSYVLEVVAFGWTMLWIDAAGAAMSKKDSDEISWGMVLLYLVSFFWTQQVINNLQHTIVSSVIGTWWYKPEDANFCWDDGLNRAICHSLTLSFGSVCFGSLLAGVIQALKYTHRLAASYENKLMKCVAACIDCFLSCVQGAVEYFNKWAYTFVGLHGESYIQSGKQVSALFKQRGWVAIVGDFLADAVMLVMKISVSLLTALGGLWLVNHDNDIFVNVGVAAEKDDVYGFVAGGLIGFLICSIMMELVGSAVCSVIVCFAEAPDVFHRNYPDLCEEMLAAWKRAYPDECADDFSSIKAQVV